MEQSDQAIFPVVGDCMERAGIENGGWVAVDFTHMPRAPKYGKDGYEDPCLCLSVWPGAKKAAVMIKAYGGKWGAIHTVSTRYADQQAGNEHRMDIGLFADRIYGVIFASWGQDGRLKWQHDPEKFPIELPAVSTVHGGNCGEPEAVS